MLAELNFRHELEADIEPFRGLLLALFFMGVGMGIDLAVVRDNIVLIVAAALARHHRSRPASSMCCSVRPAGSAPTPSAPASVLTAAGEFAFVLLPLGGGARRCCQRARRPALFAAIAAITMLLGPLAATRDREASAPPPKAEQEADDFSDASGSVLIIGFGRFGQIVSQCLLTQGVDVTAIDTDPEMIDAAGRFGFKVYYGDGRAARRAARRRRRARAADRGLCRTTARPRRSIVDLINEQFPDTKLYVRSYDRTHTLDLIKKGVNFELRETLELALSFGRAALEGLGVDAERAQAVRGRCAPPRSRAPRLAAGRRSCSCGTDLWLRKPRPEPLVVPGRRAKGINPEAETIIRESESKAEAG